MDAMVAGIVESPLDGRALSCTGKISKPETCASSAVSATEATAIEQMRQRVDDMLANGAAGNCRQFKDEFCRAVVDGRFTRACCALNEIDPLLTQDEWHSLMDLMNEESGRSVQ